MAAKEDPVFVVATLLNTWTWTIGSHILRRSRLPLEQVIWRIIARSKDSWTLMCVLVNTKLELDINYYRLVERLGAPGPTFCHHARVDNGRLRTPIQYMAAVRTSEIQERLLLCVGARILPCV